MRSFHYYLVLQSDHFSKLCNFCNLGYKLQYFAILFSALTLRRVSTVALVGDGVHLVSLQWIFHRVVVLRQDGAFLFREVARDWC